jgi:aminotransferase
MAISEISSFASQRAAYMAARPRNRMLDLAGSYRDVISLGRGDPDLPTPPHIVEAAYRAMLEGETHYTPVLGILPLRQAVADKMRRENGVDFSPDREIMITTGGQEGINAIMLALLDPGDEVILLNPGYGSYELAGFLAGGRMVHVPLHPERGFQLDPADLEAAITPRTKAVVVISPNNPTGTVFPSSTLEAIAAIAQRHDILVIHDEIYEKILFDDATHHSIAGLPNMRERTIVLNGFSKLYSMTGWRVGWVAAAAPLMKGMEVIKHTQTICTPAPSQWAALAAVTGPQDCVAETIATYARRRQWLLDGLREVGLDVAPHGGSVFIFADIRGSGMTSEAFALGLLHEKQVVTYPGSEFGAIGEGFLRLSLLAPDERFREAVSRMMDFVLEHRR